MQWALFSLGFPIRGSFAQCENMNTESIAKYHITTYWSEDDNAFNAEIPDLAGCILDGPMEEETRRNIQCTAQEWINRAQYQGREIPAPKSLIAA